MLFTSSFTISEINRNYFDNVSRIMTKEGLVFDVHNEFLNIFPDKKFNMTMTTVENTDPNKLGLYVSKGLVYKKTANNEFLISFGGLLMSVPENIKDLSEYVDCEVVCNFV